MFTKEDYDELFNKKIEEKDPNEVSETLSVESALLKLRKLLIYDD